MGQNQSDIRQLISRLLSPDKIRRLLLKAVKSDDVEAVQVLLESGISTDFYDEFGKCPIHYAVERDVGVLKVLIKNGANLTVVERNRYQRTPLFIAIQSKRIVALKLLLDKNVSIDAISPCQLGMTPLLFACKYSETETVYLLLKYGANIRNSWIWKINKVVPLDVLTHRIHQATMNRKDRKTSFSLMPRSRSVSPVAGGRRGTGNNKNRRVQSSTPTKRSKCTKSSLTNLKKAEEAENDELKLYETIFDRHLYTNLETTTDIFRILLKADNNPLKTLKLFPGGHLNLLNVLKRLLNRFDSQQRYLAIELILALIYHGYRPSGRHLIFFKSYDDNLSSAIHRILHTPLSLTFLAAVKIRLSFRDNAIYSTNQLLINSHNGGDNTNLQKVQSFLEMHHVPCTNLISL